MIQLQQQPTTALWLVFMSFFMFGTDAQAANLVETLAPLPEIGRHDAVIAKTIVVRLQPGYEMPAALQSLLHMPEVSSLTQLLKPEQSLTHNAKLHSLDRIQRSESSIQAMMQAEAPLLRTFRITYTPDELPEHYAQRLLKTFPEVECAEPYYLPQFLMGDGTPNDPRIPEQELLETIRALEAWEIYDGDPDVVIGISDSGVFQGHKDLRDNLWENAGEIPDNDIDDDNNGYIDDWQGCNFGANDDGTRPGVTIGDGHGTGVAGIVGATANNEEGIVGTGNKCRIFPMKTQPNGSGPIYLWESVVYAANMGFDVLNCSWGSYNYSEINRAIISYAISRDVAIVAGGGNHGDTRGFYPAGYAGVLGVGLTWQDDDVAVESAFGPNVRIMAPGQRSLTTDNLNQYGRFDLTSAATPIVSGVVAHARGLHPQLSAVQALEFVRQCAVPILERNPEPEYAQLLPGRVDLLNVVTRDPFATPSIAALEYEFRNGDGPINFPDFGEETLLAITLRNYLGAAENLRFSLSIVDDSDEILAVMNSETVVASIAAGEQLLLDKLSFRMRKTVDEPLRLFFRVDISDEQEGGYRDFFLLPFNPDESNVQGYATYANANIRFSMGDRGSIGFAGLTRADNGVGFQYGPARAGSILFQGGLMAALSEDQVVSAVKSQDPRTSSDDFAVLASWDPARGTSVIDDSKAPESRRLGLRIEQTLAYKLDNSSIARLDLRITNISGGNLFNLALGAYLDWDLGPQGNNDLGEKFMDGQIPGDPLASGVIGIVENTRDYPVAVLGAYSRNENAAPQLAIFHNDNRVPGTPFGTYDGFTNAEKFRSLSSGMSLNFGATGEIATVVGLRFEGNWLNDEVREMSILFGAVENLEAVEDGIELAVAAVPTSVERSAVLSSDPALHSWRINSQPVQGSAQFHGMPLSQLLEITVFDVIGRATGIETVLASGTSSASVDFDVLRPGAYFVLLRSGAHSLMLPTLVD